MSIYNYFIGFFHSVYFSYKGYFGGDINGKNKKFYILWTIHLHSKNKQVFKDCSIQRSRHVKPLFYIHIDS